MLNQEDISEKEYKYNNEQDIIEVEIVSYLI